MGAASGLRRLALSVLIPVLFVSSSRAAPLKPDLRPEAFLLSDEDLARAAADPIPRQLALEDFSVFEHVLKNAYAGYDHHRRRGLDWDRLFSRSRAALAGRAQWSAAAYFAVLTDLLADARLTDNHLSLGAHAAKARLSAWPGLSSSSARFADAYVRKDAAGFWLVPRGDSSAAGRQLLEVEGGDPERFLFPTYDASRRQTFYLLGSLAATPKESLRCAVKGGGSLVLPLRPARMGGWQAPPPVFEQKRIDGIPVVSLRSLQMTHAARLEEFIRGAEELKDEGAIVLDLRGCAGGNDSYGIRWLQGLSRGTVRTSVRKRRIVSSLTLAGEANRWRSRLSEATDGLARRQIESNLKDALARFQASLGSPGARWETTELSYEGAAAAGFKGALIVLSDRRNASACESFARVARQLPGSVLIGENSYGVNTFGPINLYRLPHSGVLLRLGEAISDAAGVASEGTGLIPDIWIDETDALPAALEYAKASLAQGLTDDVPVPSAKPRLSFVDCLSPAPLSGICKRPPPEASALVPLGSLPRFDPASEDPWRLDLRGRDLRSLDLSERADDLLQASFDTTTRFPGRLPKAFDPDAILELGKNPGLGVRRLHRRGLTGKGVAIAVIDQNLLVGHAEYARNLRSYEELHWNASAEEASMHAPAVAALAAGKDCGVAPGASLHLIADWFTDASSEIDYAPLAQAVDRVVAFNASAPREGRIRVLAIARGFSPEEKGYAQLEAAVGRARRDGIFVITSSLSRHYGFSFGGLDREPTADPEKTASYRLGAFLRRRSVFGAASSTRTLLVPMDSRTAASPAGASEYVFYREGGFSWAIPYLAGLYALAAEARPDVTPELFWESALGTGTVLTVEKDGKELEAGRIVDPVRLIERLKSAR